VIRDWAEVIRFIPETQDRKRCQRNFLFSLNQFTAILACRQVEKLKLGKQI